VTVVGSEFVVELAQSTRRVWVLRGLRSVVVQEADDLPQQYVMLLRPQQVLPVLALKLDGRRRCGQRVGRSDVGRGGVLNASKVVGDGAVGVEAGVAG